MFKLAARWEVRIFLGVFLIGLAFAAYTQHAWEDFLIVLRQSQNLAQGHGLVYQVGERVHTFTSPLGVLLPAAISWVIGAQSYESVLWVFRVISLAALASGAVLLYQILRRFQRHGFATGFTLVMIALDAKTIDFSINGMETGLLLFFLALALHGLLLSGPRQLWRIGFGFAGLMWCRPDSCVYIAALGLGALLFLPGAASNESRGRWFKRLLWAGAVCAMLYLPWFLWSWWYYGSPVPNPIIAKAANNPHESVWGLVRNAVLFPFLQLSSYYTAAGAYLPHYGADEWSKPVLGITQGFAWLASVAWLCPWLRPQTRVLSFAAYAGQVYLAYVVKYVFPWYWPAVAILGYLTNGLILDQLLDLPQRLSQAGRERSLWRHTPTVARTGSVLLLGGQLVLLVCVARQMQVLQTVIENGVRRPLGLWLHDHARSPADTVMLEPLGYIGYFSQLRMLDFLGLASKQMVAVRLQLGRERQNQAYLELKPDWLVLTPRELAGEMSIDSTRLRDFYELAAVFDQSKQLEAIPWLPARRMIAFYQSYFVLRRKVPGETSINAIPEH